MQIPYGTLPPEPPSANLNDYFTLLILYAVMGAVGGAALGLALKHWRKVTLLALTGAASLAVTHEILKFVLFPKGVVYFELETVLVFPVEAAIAGAALGAVLGYLEKRSIGRR